jgi:hypothetical protein
MVPFLLGERRGVLKDPFHEEEGPLLDRLLGFEWETKKTRSSARASGRLAPPLGAAVDISSFHSSTCTNHRRRGDPSNTCGTSPMAIARHHDPPASPMRRRSPLLGRNLSFERLPKSSRGDASEGSLQTKGNISSYGSRKRPPKDGPTTPCTTKSINTEKYRNMDSLDSHNKGQERSLTPPYGPAWRDLRDKVGFVESNEGMGGSLGQKKGSLLPKVRAPLPSGAPLRRRCPWNRAKRPREVLHVRALLAHGGRFAGSRSLSEIKFVIESGIPACTAQKPPPAMIRRGVGGLIHSSVDAVGLRLADHERIDQVPAGSFGEENLNLLPLPTVQPGEPRQQGPTSSSRRAS